MRGGIFVEGGRAHKYFHAERIAAAGSARGCASRFSLSLARAGARARARTRLKRSWKARMNKVGITGAERDVRLCLNGAIIAARTDCRSPMRV